MEKPILFGQKFLYGPKDYTGESKQLSDDWRSYQNDKLQVAYTLLRREPVSGETSEWRPPFVSNQRTADWISRQAYQQLVARVEEERNRRAQDLSNSQIDVERYEKYISFARTKLSDATMKLHITCNNGIQLSGREVYALVLYIIVAKFLIQQMAFDNLPISAQNFYPHPLKTAQQEIESRLDEILEALGWK